MRFGRKSLIFPFLVTCFNLWAQQPFYTIKGKVTDASSGEAVPFAAIALKGLKSGTTTDFEGFYTLKVKTLSDSIIASFLGYKSRTKALNKTEAEQTIDFQLASSSIQLQGVVIHAGENPAWAILRKVINNKNLNDRKNFIAYEYESYNRTEVDIDNISDKLKQQKIIGQIAGAADKIQKLAGEDGKPLLPIFVAEAVSNLYFRDNPKKSKEIIQKQKITGVGFVENDVITQLIGSSFQEYNFYNNYLRLLSKDFVSPIADNWRQNYDYYLKDSTMVGENFCYIIEFEPKNKMDLAFTGKMWIDKTSAALVQINVQIGKEANLNYIEKVKIAQEYDQIEGKAWMPTQTRIVLDIAELTPNSAGFVAKFYTSNQNIIINKPRPVGFFDLAIEIAPDSKENDDAYWQKARRTPMTQEEKSVYAMIDTVKNLPIIKKYTRIFNVLTTGYVKMGKIDIGPYPLLYAYNTFEGSRFRIGVRTNTDFSRRWFLKANLAYGVHDEKYKWGVEATRILSRRHYSDITAYHTYDVEQIGINYDDLGINYLTNTLFRGLSRFGTFRRPYYLDETSISFNSEPAVFWNYSLGIRHKEFSPNYPFYYRVNPEESVNSPLSSNFQTTELFGEVRYAKGEETAHNNRNRKVRLRKAREYPVLMFRYTAGIEALGGHFNYQKYVFIIQKSIRMGILGRTETELSIGYTPSTIPYPLLFIHQGNRSPIFIKNAFNMMNYFEFVSDKYASFRFQHNFEGLFTNRIPLLKKLNWRTHLNGRVLMGSATQANQDIIPTHNLNGEMIPRFESLRPGEPYIELGYGISNIFKVARVDFLHRLTYLDKPNTPKFAIKASFEIKL